MKVVYEIALAGYPIKLEQYGGSGEYFRVTYGTQVSHRMGYSAAVYALGSCIMHALRLEGRINEK